jgi:hypothetical protein
MASAAAGEASTPEPAAREKPIVVRVKRKPSQSRPDAFCEPPSFPFLSQCPTHHFPLEIFHSIKYKECFEILFSALLSGLEINERPAKKAMLDFSRLSISEPSSSSSSASAKGTRAKKKRT